MPFERSLLERIAAGDAGTKMDLDPGALADSVMRNLQRLFNVRHGNVEVRGDFGLPDINGLAQRFPDTVAAFKKAIKKTIESFEPRLRRITVKYVPNEDDPLSLRYEITAQLIVEGRRMPVLFETVVGDQGHISVRG